MRRFVLWLTIGLLIALPACAGAHDTQAPGWFRYKLGDFVVTALQDGSIALPASALQGVSPEQIRALVPRGLAPDINRVPTSVNAYLVDTGTHRILVDGGGADCYGFNLGGLPASLKSAGYAPDDIDIVVLTHLHGDHICGLGIGGKRVFPKAVVWIADAEAAYWLDPKNAATPNGAREALALYGRDVRRFKPGDVIVPEMTIVPTPGHTPAHTGFQFQSKGATLLAFGDIVHFHFVQFAHPEAWIGSDVDHDGAIATRNAVFAKAAADGTLIAGAHLPFPGIGWITKDGDGYAFVPAEFSPRP